MLAVVFAVSVVFWTLLILYLLHLDRRLSEIEKQARHRGDDE